MVPADPALDESTARPDGDDERAFLRAIAEGLADDAAGRVMSTEVLKADLERRLGPIAWR
jgi:predicted transcriptional regulator